MPRAHLRVHVDDYRQLLVLLNEHLGVDVEWTLNGRCTQVEDPSCCCHVPLKHMKAFAVALRLHGVRVIDVKGKQRTKKRKAHLLIS